MCTRAGDLIRLSQTRRAMTLVEVLAVVVILGLLAGTLAVGFSGAFGKGRHELARTGIASIVNRLELYNIARSEWPALEQGLNALTAPEAKPTDEYFIAPENLSDPWGRPYQYITPGPDDYPYEVLSFGADGQPGGEGENADISSTSLRASEQS
ncbi:MAG: type II secretion system major pseudopilin GspG [Planctomycetota bacterium]